MDKGLVSIVVPLYNCEDRILRCVQSILDQTYKNIEIIVINDGSTDNSLKVLQEGISDSRLKVFTQDNHGVSYTRNRGIEIALSNETDGWITFVDSDDYIDPNTIYDCLDYDDLDSVELIHYGFRRTNENDIETQNFCDKQKKIITQEEALYNEMQGRINIRSVNGNWLAFVTSGIFRKKIIKDNHLFFNDKLDIGEDFIFTIQYLDYCNSIRLVSMPYHTWWQRKGSLTNVNKTKAFRLMATCKILWPMMFERLQKFNHKLDSTFALWIISYFNFFAKISAQEHLSFSEIKNLYQIFFEKNKIIDFTCMQKLPKLYNLERYTQSMLKTKSIIIVFIFVKALQCINKF